MTAPLPPQPLPKSNASADFLAMLLVVKFIDGLPLARFEYVLDRHGVAVPRQTLARWVIGAGQLLHERDYKDASDARRLQARQEHSVLALAALRTWLDKTLPGVTPKSALGTALSYMRDYWSRLIRYTERGDLPIDNNRCENAIRPFVVGRKVWLFSDTPAGANASAVIYSVLQTAKANGLEPYTWLRQVLRDLPVAKTVDDVAALLPSNMKELHTPDLTSDAES